MAGVDGRQAEERAGSSVYGGRAGTASRQRSWWGCEGDHTLEPGSWLRLGGLTSLDLSRAWKMRLHPRLAVLMELCSPLLAVLPYVLSLSLFICSMGWGGAMHSLL